MPRQRAEPGTSWEVAALGLGPEGRETQAAGGKGRPTKATIWPPPARGPSRLGPFQGAVGRGTDRGQQRRGRWEGLFPGDPPCQRPPQRRLLIRKTDVLIKTGFKTSERIARGRRFHHGGRPDGQHPPDRASARAPHWRLLRE